MKCNIPERILTSLANFSYSTAGYEYFVISGVLGLANAILQPSNLRQLKFNVKLQSRQLCRSNVKNYFDCPVNVELINGVSMDHSNYLSGFSTDYFLCQNFWAES